MENNMKNKIHSCVALICLFALLFSSMTVQATSVDDLENSAAAKQNELDSINNELVSLAEEIDSVNQQIIMTEGAIAKSKADIASIQVQEDLQYNAMKARIKYLYEAGNTSFLELLLTAEDMNDFLNKADFIQNMNSYDREQLTVLNTTHQQLADEQDILKAQQASLSKMKSNSTDKQLELEAKAQSAATDLNSINEKLQAAKEEEAAALAAEAARQGAASQTVGASGTINVGNSSASSDDMTLLAAICQAEAYPQYDYLLAVATVIMNRVNSSRFPNSISGVVYASGQFEPTWSGRLNKIINEGPSSLSMQVAQDAINGARLASVSDCYFFLAAWTGHSGINVGDNVFFQSW